MSKILSFEYDGTHYELEYTRRTVREMEKAGFVLDELDTKPMSVLPDLFAGSFLAHHRFAKPSVIEDIYKCMPDKSGLINKLCEMYNDTVKTLLEDPDDNTEKKVNWTTNW